MKKIPPEDEKTRLCAKSEDPATPISKSGPNSVDTAELGKTINLGEKSEPSYFGRNRRDRELISVGDFCSPLELFFALRVAKLK